MRGLVKNTEKILRLISDLPCINQYILVGGTALSLHINKRKSDDLDFCRWSKNLKSDRPAVDWPAIEQEL